MVLLVVLEYNGQGSSTHSYCNVSRALSDAGYSQGNGVVRLGDVLHFESVSVRASPGSFSFQRGYFPIFEVCALSSSQLL